MPQTLSMGNKSFSFGCLATAQIDFNLDSYVFGKMFFFFFFFFFLLLLLFFFSEENTGTQKAIFLDFTTAMHFDLLYKPNNTKDGFYCKG